MATDQKTYLGGESETGSALSAISAPLTAIWSRDVDPGQLAGRPRIILAVRRAMTEVCLVEHLRLSNLLERRTAGAFLWAVFSGAAELLRGRLPSLQCLLFSDGSNHRRLRKRLEAKRPQTLYCDGVRSYYFLRRLGPARRKMHIVVDLDDLMSRRMELLGQSGFGLSLGYLHGRAPDWVIRLLTKPSLARLVAAWEGSALRQVENDIGRWADTVVLLSPLEGAELAGRYDQIGASARVHVIPPPIEIAAPPQDYSQVARFVFIGTDVLPQNHATIAQLIDLWARLKPTTQLHIFGNMSHRWPGAPGVVFQGYAPSLAEVYSRGGVLLAPGALRGGVKTKVLEAFANGCAVVGNSITFEGLKLKDYPLCLDDQAELSDLIMNPHGRLETFRRAAIQGQAYVAGALQWTSFSAAWRGALGIRGTRDEPK